MYPQYKCPVCGEILELCEKSFTCRNSHNFDMAKEGYVNFALGKHDSGDSAEMCASRRSFLGKGYYAPFAKLICDTVEKYAPHTACLVDAGCGEGYYLRCLRERFGEAHLYGIDLAKNAVKLAAKSEKQVQGLKNMYSVCGIFSLPFADSFANAVISVFAPVGEAENLRVLKPGGFMFVAGPGKRHLSGLKSALYDVPYDNEEKQKSYNGFTYVGKESVSYTAKIDGADIADLFTMTPYYWKTKREDSAKLAALPELETQLEFEINVYKK